MNSINWTVAAKEPVLVFELANLAGFQVIDPDLARRPTRVLSITKATTAANFISDPPITSCFDCC
jgi:hypothetical protein